MSANKEFCPPTRNPNVTLLSRKYPPLPAAPFKPSGMIGIKAAGFLTENLVNPFAIFCRKFWR